MTAFERLIEPILKRLALIVGQCVVFATKYKDGEMLADVELIAGEKRRGLDFLQQFGFSSHAKGKVDGVALFVGGSRDNGVVISTRGECPDLKEGEVMVHSPFGQKVYLKSDGSVEIANKNGGSIVMRSSGSVSINGHLEVAL